MSSTDIAMMVLFWVCLSLILHTFLLYPITLRLFRKKFSAPPMPREEDLPRVAVLIAAYNEEAVIGRKVENCLEQDYPPERLSVFVGSDGSRDRTDEIVIGFNDPRVKLIRPEGRNGKPLVLNHLYHAARDADVLIISDADVVWDRDAVKMAMRHFADSSVGVVSCGRYTLPSSGDILSFEEQEYANHENRLKALETQIGGMSGGTGMFLAIRRDLYQPFAAGSANDDTVPMIWAAFAGERCVWDMDVRAYEHCGQSFREEFRRRIRIGAGNFQTLFRYAKVNCPRFGIAAYTFFSHKTIRWVLPLLLIAILISGFMLRHLPIYKLFWWGQLAGYGLAALGGLFVAFNMKLRPLSSLFHFVAMNVALLLGFVRYLRMGKRRFVWEPTQRNQ